MSSCTYKFKNASGEEVAITGQAEMKAFLANGGLEQLLPGKVLPWRGGSVAAPAESPKAKAKTGPATAQQAIDAFNADDSAAAMDVVARLKLEALNEVGAAIGFRPQIHENAKSYRSRLAEVAEKLTKTGREEGKKKRALWDRMSLLASDWDRMERHTGTPEGSYDGKWMTHAQARPYLLAEIGSLQSSPYFAEIRPMVENARPSIFNALDSVASPAESPKVEAKPDSKPFALSDLDAIQSSLRDGTASIEQYQSAWASFKQGQDAFMAELTKKTKPQLLDMVGGYMAYRLKSENKPDIIKAVFEAARNVFGLGRDYGPQSFYMGEYKKYQEAKDKAFAEMVEATTAEDLRKYADEVSAADAESQAKREEVMQAIKDPQTLEDYRTYMRAAVSDGKTEAEARLALTPEQRARMDDLYAEESRKGRTSRPEPAVSAASVTTGGDVVATKHTQTGEDLYVVRPAERVERDQYNIWNATAKRLGGWYSKYRGNGAVPGFQFKTRESADAFLAYIGGDTEGAKQVAQERRDAFADDRSQSSVERLVEMADRLEERADESLSRDRKANTSRRARMAASAEASANADKAMARTMRNIANAIKDGKAKFLDKVRQKVQVEMLQSFLADAKYKELTARYPIYADFERNRYDPAGPETADYATFPKYTADRSDLARMGREMELVEGSKKMGQQLLKIADDATDEYLKFVKENLHKVSTFRLKDGSPAIYSSRDDAERAIARSGYRGKAMVFAVKRGQNMIVMGPAMAKENGLWTADNSKRITLTDGAGEEITAKAEAANSKTERVYVPHQFSWTREKRRKLKAMGIETAAEFRAALREFIALSTAPERPSKVKELERAMIGRRNDGLDFFPTPSGIAQQMIDAADIKDGMSVLEPSAGMGHIAEQIREAGVDPDVVELSADRRELLEAKGFNVVANDFMEASGEYDRIVMNPPFSDRRDAQHVQHAYTMLKPGGKLVAIMGEGVFFGQDKKAKEFRDWLDAVGGTSEKLPDGSFLDPSLPVNTGVNARMVVIEKADNTQTDDAPSVLRNDYPDTQAFREWFGNSKMTNKAGEPLLFMHGSPASFEAFDSSKLGTSSLHTSSGLGHFFTRDRATAEKYADGGNIYTGWLRIEKPYVMMLEEAQAFDDAAESAKRRAELQKQGYDGAIILDDEGKPWATVAFEPWQFKSTDNNGSFDEFDDRMRFRDDPSSMRDATTVPRDQAEEFIRKFVAEYPGAPQIMLADSFYQLPEDIQSDALEQGSGPTRAKGALKNGKAYVVLNTHTSMADLEASVFHEVLGHAGIRKLLGQAFAQELNKMFIGLGGYSKLYQIMSRRGMGRQFEGYYDAVQRAREKNPEVWTEFLASSILTEEVFAHIAEQKNAKALRDRFMALVGMVRDWLRRNGFARLASMGESDIVFLLQRARAGLKNGSGVIRDGVTIGETVIVDAEGRPVAKKGSPDYEMLKAVSERMGLRETNGPTVFSNSLPEEGKPGDDARMDDANDVAGKQAPTPAGDVEGSAQWAYEAYQSGVVPDGWYVHGRAGRGDLNTNNVLQLTKSWDVADQYAGRTGSKWLIRPTGDASELDLSDSDTTDMDRVVSAALDDFDRGRLSWLDDLEGALGRDADESDVEDAVRSEFAPDDIVDTAKAYDNQAMSEWLAYRFDYPSFVKTPDGAVVFSREGIESVRVPNESPASASSDAPTVFRTVTPEQLNAYAQPRGQAAKEVVGNLIAAFREPSSKIFNVLHKTISTPLHKASISKDYDRVFRLAQDYQNDIARFAAGPADAAPRMLPSYDSIRQAFSRLVHGNKYAKLKGAVADAIFEGTLAGEDVTSGRVWTDAELRDRYDMTDDQIGLYREARDAIDASLDSAAAGLAWQAVKKYIPDMKGAVRHEHADAKKIIDAAMRQAEEELLKVAKYEAEVEKAGAIPKGTAEKTLNKAKSIAEASVAAEGIFARANALKAGGYAPLMRFGKYAVDAVRKLEDGTEERITFMRFESELEAKTAAQKIRKLHPDAEVKRSIISEEAWKIYKGVDPELVSLFAESLDGVEGLSVKEDVLQEWYRNAVSERSSFKRMIHRKGTDGFDRDITRVLASFITSNSRLAARQFNMGDISEALADMNERKVSGDVLDDATGLKEYIDNPEKPFKAMKGMMFAFFLGGSVASAALNLTQPMMMTFPYLSQYGARKAGAALRGAAAEAAKGSVSDKELGRALSRATKDGIVDPQQIHHLYHESLRSFLAKLPLGEGLQERAQGLMTLWGMMFGATENFNRRLTFIAAYRMAKDDPSLGNPYDFAAKAVEETQGIYNDANIPNWARGNGSFGALGVAAFAFKQYSIGYVELLIRLAKSGKNGRKGAAIMLGTLVLMSGMQGAPGADDLEDVIDTVAQYMGYTGNSRLALRKSLESGLGNVFAQETAKEMAHIIMYGGLSVLPGDLASRTGLGNLFPATAIAKPSEQNRGSQIAEIFGPPLGMANQVLDATLAMESGAGALGVASAFAPVAVRNWIKAYDMASTGQYRDTKGRKVVDVTAGDVALKAIGIQPTVVSDDTKSARLVNLTKQRITQVKSAISSLKAQGIADRNPEMKARADAMVKEWNEKNPDATIRINDASILKRVKEINTERRARLLKAMPKDFRATAAESYSE